MAVSTNGLGFEGTLIMISGGLAGDAFVTLFFGAAGTENGNTEARTSAEIDIILEFRIFGMNQLLNEYCGKARSTFCLKGADNAHSQAFNRK